MTHLKNDTFHIIISPNRNTPLRQQVDINLLEQIIEDNFRSYMAVIEQDNHIHIMGKYYTAVRQDVVRKLFKNDKNKKIKNLINWSINTNNALRVKFYGDWQYGLGYINKEESKEILLRSDDIKDNDIKEGLRRYNAGEEAKYIETKEEVKKKWMSYDEIVLGFGEWCVASKICAFNNDFWQTYLTEIIDKILPSTHARIRKEPLEEYVNCYCRKYLIKDGKNGKYLVGITKELPTNKEKINYDEIDMFEFNRDELC